jgi:hypothetical protein
MQTLLQTILPGGLIATLFLIFWFFLYGKTFVNLLLFRYLDSKVEILMTIFLWVYLSFAAFTLGLFGFYLIF